MNLPVMRQVAMATIITGCSRLLSDNNKGEVTKAHGSPDTEAEERKTGHRRINLLNIKVFYRTEVFGKVRPRHS